MGISGERLQDFFDSVEQVALIEHPYAMPYETNLPVYVARGPKQPMAELWPLAKHYD